MMTDNTTEDLWTAMKRIYAATASTDPEHPLTRPLLSDKKIYVGAMLGFGPKQAQVILSDRLTLRALQRVWIDYALFKGEDALPQGLQERIEEEAATGGPQWNLVLRNIAGFGQDWIDQPERLFSALPEKMKALLLGSPGSESVGAHDEDRVLISRGSHREPSHHFRVEARREDRALAKTDMALAAGDQTSVARFDPSKWERTWSVSGFRIGARLDENHVILGLYSAEREGSYDLTLTWANGASEVVHGVSAGTKFTKQYPTPITAPDGQLPELITLAVAQR